MAAPELILWSYLTDVLDAMLAAGELDIVLKGLPAKQAPSSELTRRGVSIFPASTAESSSDSDTGDLAPVGPVLSANSFVLEVFTNDMGGETSLDLVAGTASRPGVMQTAARVRDTVDANLREWADPGLAWSWPTIVFRFDGEYPRQLARLSLQISLEAPGANRAGGNFPPAAFMPAYPPGVYLTSGSTPLNLPLFTGGDPVGVVNGDAWLALIGGVVTLRYKREDTGVVVGVALS